MIRLIWGMTLIFERETVQKGGLGYRIYPPLAPPRRGGSFGRGCLNLGLLDLGDDLDF